MAANQSFTFKIEGLEDTKKALQDLVDATSSSTGKRVLARALMNAAKPIAAHARALVPVRSGQLRDSIAIAVVATNNTGKTEYAEVLKAGGSPAAALDALKSARRSQASAGEIQVIVGPGLQPHASLVEFGSIHNRPQPYMRPAWELGKGAVMADFKAALTAEIDKAAKRAARRTAKIAAKNASGR